MSVTWRSSERRIDGEIMRTEIFVKLLSPDRSEAAMAADIETAMGMFRDFAARFSRFDPESELSRFNRGRGGTVSPMLADILARSARWHRQTEGLFDPSVLPALESAGYASSFRTPEFGVPADSRTSPEFETLIMDENRRVEKPPALRVDLGGIGKGYVTDRVVGALRRNYRDFIVSAGGDIYAEGANRELGYEWWAIDVERSPDSTIPAATLLVRDRAVATSGIGRRTWTVDGETRHHLIDPRTGRPAETDVAQATVIAATVEEAEVMSKCLCILGTERARRYAEERSIPIFLVTTDGETVYNEPMKPYVWTPQNP